MTRVLGDSEVSAITNSLENMLAAATNLTTKVKPQDYIHLTIILDNIAAIANELKEGGKPT